MFHSENCDRSRSNFFGKEHLSLYSGSVEVIGVRNSGLS